MEGLPPTHKHHNPVFSLGVIVLGLMLILMFVLMTFQKPGESKTDDIGFKPYKPSVLLAENSSVLEKIVLNKEASIGYEHYSYELKYAPDNIVVSQEAAGEYAKVIAVCSSKPPLNIDYTYDCKVKPIKDNGRYMVQKSYYKGELFSVSTEALIGKTKIWFVVPESLEKKYSQTDFQKYFDSMVPIDATKVPRKTEVHKQGGG